MSKSFGRPKKSGRVVALRTTIHLWLGENGERGEDDDLRWLAELPPRKAASAIKTALRTGGAHVTPEDVDALPNDDIFDLMSDLSA